MLPLHIFSLVMELEGRDTITNDPDDPGGLTKWGICQRDHPDVDVANLTEVGARAIYDREYWTPAGCENFTPALALAVFDAAVNQGVVTAIRMLQRSLFVPVDGLLGPQTINAANVGNEGDVVERFMVTRLRRYIGTANADKYLAGWGKRVVIITRHAIELCQ